MKDSLKSLDRDTAKKMIAHFKSPKVKKIKNVAWTEFDPKELIALLSQENVVGAKFFLAAHHEEHPAKDKHNYPVILLQLKFAPPTTPASAGLMSTEPSFAYHEGTGVLCPPPDAPPCDMENEEQF